MDISDYTRVVFDKIHKFEPEYAVKIIRYLQLQDNVEQEMAKLASCHDHFIREVAFKAKVVIQGLAARPVIFPISPPLNNEQGLSHLLAISPITPTSPPSFQVPSPFWNARSVRNTNPDTVKKQPQLFSLENCIEPVNTEIRGTAHDYFRLDAPAANFGVKVGRRHSRLSEFPVKTCYYFNNGYCKHGTSCRYYHGLLVSESFPHMYGSDANNEGQMFLPGSLAQLEKEIVELLKPRRGSPLSIALLPLAYEGKYNKALQADGYLTESQRHGKSGFSLTKLLARLKNSIQLIDKPHGQHAVVLAEDAPKYMQKGDFGQSISASRQIYLTFPAESTFTEEDVSNYFNTFGWVEDVRIPCQQRRMFGFVTFVDPETVKTILEKGNPHYVNRSRVLVKPYREKAKVVDRKFPDRIEHPICYSPHYVDMDPEYPLISRSCGNHSSLATQVMEEDHKALQQRRCLAELKFAKISLSSSPQFSLSMDGSRVSDDAFNFKPKQTDSNSSDGNSQQLNLPDSPFAFPMESGIEAVM
ncbi:putative transcription factor C3H family [Lupinus albus]|uniref:Putative transcription factor C3H family n=1 Tax=Lupinus albus TaxID=3870 RepID=A0A6A4PXG7_LUPAL|nr:putative transcription factor C3H family [Lupinus albus]